ncbi:MAG: OmpA family protein [Bacteroidia bacterium]|nr:OmpA family protein [Bacteroidia bacterium]
MRYLSLLLFLFSTAYGQIAADCQEAIYLKLSRDSTSFLIPEAPQGFGKQQEISAPSKDPHFFRKEHHTAWYKFRSPFSGILSLEITPFDKKNDYDFLLFQDTTGNFCEDLAEKRILPLRSVISRNDPSIDSKTGLSAYSGELHIREGPGSSYGESIQVKKGGRYYLVLDNVYGGGKGHQIDFHYYYPAKLFGNIAEMGSGKILEGEVAIIDAESGNKIDSVKVLPVDKGKFRLNPPLEYGKTYKVQIESPDYFKTEIPFKRSKTPLKITLLPQKRNVNIVFKDINFYGNSDRFLPRATEPLQELLKVMRSHPSLVIQVDGHVNGAGSVRTFDENELKRHQDLSDRRAKAVRVFLVNEGISNERIETKGYGARRMLFPQTIDDIEMMKNRRVEIKILDF